MQILVTGATSIIGVPLIKRLVEIGHDVYAVVRPNSANIERLKRNVQSERLNYLEIDMSEIEARLPETGKQFDICFHFAWDGAGSENRKKREVQQKNVVDSMIVLRACEKARCKKFIFSGSQAEYGVKIEKTNEKTDCTPVSEYGKAKVDFWNNAVTYLSVTKSAMQYIHTRIYSVYGPEDHEGSLINSCLNSFLQNKNINLGACVQLWNYLYIDDLIDALIAVMDAPVKEFPGTIYNIAGDETETKPLKDYIKIVHALCEERGTYSLGICPPNAEGIANLNPSIEKIIKETGWKPQITFEDGIIRIIEQRRVKNA